MSFSDRIKGGLASFIAASRPNLDYQAFYRAKVVKQNDDLTLELRPEDARLPDLASIPIRHGVPNMTVKVAAGALVLVTFENGDPQRPVAALWDSASVTELVFKGTTIKVGDGASQAAVLGDNLKSRLDAIEHALTTFLSGLNPGTLAAQAGTANTALTTGLSAIPGYLSTTVKVK